MPEVRDFEAAGPSDLPSPSTVSQSADKRRGSILLGIATGVALALYLPSVWFGVVYDDHVLFMTNTALHSWSSIPFFFTHQMFFNMNFEGVSYPPMYYRPLVMAIFIATTKLLGGQIWSYHLVSVLFYLALIPSVFFLMVELGLSRTMAGWGSLLFAIHPMHIENVAWATGQLDTIAAIPFVLALALYRRAQRLERWPLFLAALVMYMLALLSKESAVAIPMLTLFMELVWRGRIKGAAIRLATFFSITVGYFMVRLAVLGEIAHTQLPLPLTTIFFTIPSLLGFYLRQLMVPVNTSLYYDVHYVFHWNLPQFLIPAGILLVVVTLLLISWKRQWLTESEVFCCIAMFVCLGPVMNLRVFRLHQFAHDRFLYLTTIFFA